MQTRHVIMFSGGVGSWATARRLKDNDPDLDLTLVFADTKIEDPDLYRFLHEAAENLGGELIMLEDGRDPWEVFHDVRFLGNSRIDPCSKVLKRDLIRRWLNENCSPDSTVIYLGIDWTESHRFEKAQKYWGEWQVEAPLCEAPYLTKYEWIARLEDEGIETPLLYRLGFPHNNCGGFCVKAGEAHFKRLLDIFPERFEAHAQKEQEMREFLGKDVSIMRSGTMLEFKERLQRDGEAFDPYDWGGCGCFSPTQTGAQLPVSSLDLAINQIAALEGRFKDLGALAAWLGEGHEVTEVPGIGAKSAPSIQAQLSFLLDS